MGARLPDIDTLRALGFSPNLVDKMAFTFNNGIDFEDAIKRVLRKNDRQQFIKRYTIGNLPKGLTPEIIERVLYYKGAGAFFHLPEVDQYYFLPYTLNGTIDVYGRYISISPLPFNGKTDAEGNPKLFIPGLNLKVVYDLNEEVKNPDECCVLMLSYSKDMSQKILPEQQLIDPILQLEAEAIPMARTNIMVNSGLKTMRIADENDKANVYAANQLIPHAVKSGNPLLPIVGSMEWQELTSTSTVHADQMLMYMQSLDNFRLASYGITNGGLFEKAKEYVNTEAESQQASQGSEMYEDAFEQRKNAIDLINKVFGLSITITKNKQQEVVTEDEEEGSNGEPGKSTMEGTTND